MKIAVTANESTMEGTVSETFEGSNFLLVVETDDLSTTVYKKSDDDGKDYVKKIIESDCELVITGTIEKAAFEPLASVGVTRVKGTGYTVKESLELMEANKLEYIRDFNGGTGEHHRDHSQESFSFSGYGNEH